MKKWKMLAVWTALALSLAGCGGGAGQDAQDSQTMQPAREVPDYSQSLTIKRGVSQGNVYHSEFLDLTCRLDTDWLFATDDDLFAFSNVEVEPDDYDALVEALNNAPIQCDMYGYDSQGGSFVQVDIDNLSVSGNEGLDEAQYAAMAAQKLQETAADDGKENFTAREGQTDFVGAAHPCVDMEYDMSGQHWYDRQIYRMAGDVMAVVTVSSTDKSEMELLPGCFADGAAYDSLESGGDSQ